MKVFLIVLALIAALVAWVYLEWNAEEPPPSTTVHNMERKHPAAPVQARPVERVEKISSEIPKPQKREEQAPPTKRQAPEARKPVALAEREGAEEMEGEDPVEVYGENPDARPVPREKLIGGAGVEWEPPKPRDPNNPFGEPPM